MVDVRVRYCRRGGIIILLCLFDVRFYRHPSSGVNTSGYVSGGRARRASGIANRAVAFTSYLCSMPASSTNPNPETNCCPMHVLFPVLNGRKYSGFRMHGFVPGLRSTKRLGSNTSGSSQYTGLVLISKLFSMTQVPFVML